MWQAPTRVMNLFPERTVAAALEEDPARNAAEYLAQFRTDVDAFVLPDVVAACVSPDVYERGPLPGVHYIAFVDPSRRQCRPMTLAIAHKDGDVCVVDAIRERKPPFTPEQSPPSLPSC